MAFLGEIKRRKVFQVAAVYLVVAWLIIQVVDVVNEPLALPDWFDTVVILLLTIGFPIALILSWAFDLTPEGVVRDQGTKLAAAPSSGRRIEFVLIGLIVVAVGWLLYREISPSESFIQGNGDVLPNSVAVLPFENLTVDSEYAFFAPGIHDTILKELAKVRDLNVIARTSVLKYADGQTSIAQIAEDLRVETVMEGSVQYAEGRVLVTAQLIDPSTNTHIWSESYDRELTGIFEIQADIATRITTALEAELLPSERESIETQLTDSPEALEAYYRAIALIGEGESAFGVSASPGSRQAIQNYLDEALRLDPDFALAHAWKAYIYTWSRIFDPFTEQTWLASKSELDRLISRHADSALALDPSAGLAHAARAYMHINNWRAEPARVEADQALRLSPNDPTVLILRAALEGLLGQHEDAIAYAEHAVELDPNSTQAVGELSDHLHAAGRHAEASEVAQQCLAIDPGDPGCHIYLARPEFALGNDEDALNAVRLIDQLLPDETHVLHSDITYAYGLLGRPEDAQRVFDELRGLATDRYVDASVLAWAYMGIGDYEEALDLLNSAVENLELLQLPWVAYFIRNNAWSDPILEEPAWLEVRSKLAFRESVDE